MYKGLFGQSVEVAKATKQGAPGADVRSTSAPRSLAILVSDAIDWPVRDVEIVQRVGRFVLAAYTPVEFFDPQMIVFEGEDGGAFNRTVGQFQAARQPNVDWREWRSTVRVAMRLVLRRLARLKPSSEEWNFINGWLAHVLATGRTVAAFRYSEVL